MTLRCRMYLAEQSASKIKVVLGNYVRDLIAYMEDLHEQTQRRSWEQWNGKFASYYQPKTIAAIKKNFARFKSFEDYIKDEKEESRKNVAYLIRETRKNINEMARKVSSAIGSIPGWNDSNVFVLPLYKSGGFGSKEVSLNPVTSISVEFSKSGSRMSMPPDFTIFDLDGKLEIDDVLDAGDRDFFNDPGIEADYFALVNELRHPGSAARQRGKVLRLYTARPKQDRSVYDNAKQIPSNIFLTNDSSDAEGIAYDLAGSGGRDLYRVKIDEKYLIKTLDTGRLKQYQVFSKTGMVPVVNMERIS